MVVVRLAVTRLLPLRVVMIVRVGRRMPGHHGGLVAVPMIPVLVVMFMRVVVPVHVTMFMRVNDRPVLVFVVVDMQVLVLVRMRVRMTVRVAMVVVGGHRSLLECARYPPSLPQDDAPVDFRARVPGGFRLC